MVCCSEAERLFGTTIGGAFFTIIIFLFIVNNYNGEPDEGPYPPNYLESMQSYLRLSDYKGKVVLLSFWATWDENSRKSIPSLTELKGLFLSTLQPGMGEPREMCLFLSTNPTLLIL